MKVWWQVDDGYVGGRPQYTVIPDEDFEDMDEVEKQRYIEETVQADFEYKISWYIKGIDE